MADSSPDDVPLWPEAGRRSQPARRPQDIALGPPSAGAPTIPATPPARPAAQRPAVSQLQLRRRRRSEADKAPKQAEAEGGRPGSAASGGSETDGTAEVSQRARAEAARAQHAMSASGWSDDSDESTASALSWVSSSVRVAHRFARRRPRRQSFVVGGVTVPDVPGVPDTAVLHAAASVARERRAREQDARASAASRSLPSTPPAPPRRTLRLMHARKRIRTDHGALAVAHVPPPVARSASRGHTPAVAGTHSASPGVSRATSGQAAPDTTRRQRPSGPLGLVDKERASALSGAAATSAKAAEGEGSLARRGRLVKVRESALRLVLNGPQARTLPEQLATDDPATLRRRLVSEHALLEDPASAKTLTSEQRASLWDIDDQEKEMYLKAQHSDAVPVASRGGAAPVEPAPTPVPDTQSSQDSGSFTSSQRGARGWNLVRSSAAVSSLERTRRKRRLLGVRPDETIAEAMRRQGRGEGSAYASTRAATVLYVRHRAVELERLRRLQEEYEAAKRGCLARRRVALRHWWQRGAKARTRAAAQYNDFCHHAKHTVIESTAFQVFVIAVILLAAVKEGAVLYDISPAARETWTAVDNYAILVFVVECLLKIWGEGLAPWRYFADSWNVFDFLIVVLALIPGDARGQLAAFRLLRVLRVLKLIRAIPQLRVVVTGLMRAMQSIGYVSILMALEFYLFAGVAVTFFGKNDPKSFGNLHRALISLWQAATGDDWTDFLYVAAWSCAMTEFGGATYGPDDPECTHPSTMPIFAPALFFMVHIVVGSMVLLNLFIGVLMLGMQEAGDDDDDDDGDALVVHLKDAERLPAADMALSGGRSDPYAVLGVGTGATRRTRTVMRTLRPTWDKELTFNNIEKADSTTLNIDVYDWDRCRVDERLGFVAINFAPLSYGTTYHYELKLQANSTCVLREEEDEEEVEGEDEEEGAKQAGSNERGREEAKGDCPPCVPSSKGEELPRSPQGEPSSAQSADRRATVAAEAAETKEVAAFCKGEAPTASAGLAGDRPLGAFARPRPARHSQPRRRVRVRRERLAPGGDGEEKEGPRVRARQLVRAHTGLTSTSDAPGRTLASPSSRRTTASGAARSVHVSVLPAQLVGHKRLFSERRARRHAPATPPAAVERTTEGGKPPQQRSSPAVPTPPSPAAETVGEEAPAPGSALAPGGSIVQTPDQGIIRFSVTKHMSTARRLKLRRTDPAALEGLDRLVSLTHRVSLAYRHTEGMVAERRAGRKVKWSALRKHHTRVATAAASVVRTISQGLRTPRSWSGSDRARKAEESSSAAVHPARAGQCTAGAAAASRDNAGAAGSDRSPDQPQQAAAAGARRGARKSWRVLGGSRLRTGPGSALVPFTEEVSEGESDSDASTSTNSSAYEGGGAMSAGELDALTRHMGPGTHLETLDEG